MSISTKEIISRTLLELMGKKPVDKITVKDIVEQCGVNRNTFYYHFRDIPDVMEYTMQLHLRKMMLEQHPPRTIMEMLLEILSFCENNRKIILHIYKSMRRESFVQYLRVLSAYAVERLGAFSADIAPVEDEEKELMLYFIKCVVEGIFIDWVDSGMDYDLRDRLDRMTNLVGGDIRSMIRSLHGAPPVSLPMSSMRVVGQSE